MAPLASREAPDLAVTLTSALCDAEHRTRYSQPGLLATGPGAPRGGFQLLSVW